MPNETSWLGYQLPGQQQPSPFPGIAGAAQRGGQDAFAMANTWGLQPQGAMPQGPQPQHPAFPPGMFQSAPMDWNAWGDAQMKLLQAARQPRQTSAWADTMSPERRAMYDRVAASNANGPSAVGQTSNDPAARTQYYMSHWQAPQHFAPLGLPSVAVGGDQVQNRSPFSQFQNPVHNYGTGFATPALAQTLPQPPAWPRFPGGGFNFGAGVR